MGLRTKRIRSTGRLLIFLGIALLCVGDASGRAGRTLDMADLISSAASKFLGADMADGVANLVSAAFGQPPRRRGDPSEAHGTGYGTGYGTQGDPKPMAPSLFTGLLKLVGLDPNKIGALALNAIIFVAQMVSNSLIGGRPPPPQPLRNPPQMRYPTGPGGYPAYPTGPGQFNPQINPQFNSQFRTYSNKPKEEDEKPKTDEQATPEGTPLSWMLNSPLLKDSSLMKTAQDPTLTDQLENAVKSRTKRAVGSPKGRSQETSTPCIQQLVCRSAPFVWAMQRSLKDLLNPLEATKTAAQWNSLTPVQRMYAYLPAAGEIEDRAKFCKEKLPACQGTVL